MQEAVPDVALVQGTDPRAPAAGVPDGADIPVRPDHETDPYPLLGPERPAREPRAHHVTAVVVAHNGERWLRSVLRGLAEQAREPDLVVGVDTGSADLSNDLLVGTLGEDRVALAPEDAAFGSAVARGVARATDLMAGLQPVPAVSVTGSLEGFAIDDPAGEGRLGREDLAPPLASVSPVAAANAADSATDVDASGTSEPVARPVEWLWLLHDDSAPDPGALQALLDAADRRHDAVVIGPKIVGWHDHGLLLEVGVSITGGGRRETFLERRERDQGQHDGISDVLAVSSAGMLVRRDVWDDLRGFDPALEMFRDDVEFCMRARRAGHTVIATGEATVYHAEAGAHGRRELHSVVDRPHLVDRAAAIHVVLTHWPLWLLPLLVLRIVAGSVGRISSFLLGKDIAAAADEFAALVRALVQTRHIVDSRRQVARTSVLPAVALRPYLPHAADAWRHAVDLTTEVVDLATAGRLSASLTDDDADNANVVTAPVTLPLQRQGDEVENALIDTVAPKGVIVRRILRRPAVMLVGLLALASLIAGRSLIGRGTLTGGALLDIPAGSADLLAHYAAPWHDVAFGSPLASPPALALLAALAWVLGGSAPTAVSLLLVAAVPLAAISAMSALRGLVHSRWLRASAGVVYATLPPMTAAAADGRLGTLVFAIAMPLLARSLVIAVGAPAALSWRRTWWTTLLLAVTASFTPMAWWLVALGGAYLVLTDERVRGRWGHVLALVLMSLLLLGPWGFRMIVTPALWLAESGTLPAGGGGEAWHVLALSPGGHGSHLTGMAVLAAAALAFLRRASRSQVTSAWRLALVGVALACLQVALDGSIGWPGPALLVAGGAFLTAVAVAAEGLAPRLARMSFSWHHAVAAVVVAAVTLSSAASVVLWLRDPSMVRHETGTAVPEFVGADLRGPDRPRALVLARDADGEISYSVVSAGAGTLGDADVMPDVDAELSAAVSSLVAGRGGSEMATLAAHAIRYVAVVRPDAAISAALDSAVGLRRLSTDGGGLWRSTLPDARATLVVLDADDAIIDGSQAAVPVTASRPTPPSRTVLDLDVRAQVRDSDVLTEALGLPGASLALVLAERADGGWVATADGEVVPPLATPSGTVMWAVPVGTTMVTVTRDASSHSTSLAVQAVLLVGVLLLALPRRVEDDPEGEAEREFLVGRIA